MSKKPISIRQRLSIAMISMLLFETVIFVLLILFSGAFGIIVSNAYGDLSDTAARRSSAAEERLNSVSDILIYNYDKFNNIIAESSQSGDINYDSVFTQMLPNTEVLSGNDLISGVFVFGGSDMQRARIPAVYLSNTDITLKNQSSSFKIASETVIENSNILKAPSWSRTFNAKESESLDFITEPIRLAEEYPNADISELGYWSMPYDINFDNEFCIAFCLPLRDNDGNCLGVLGVQVLLDELKTYLPYLELNSRGVGSYCVVCQSDKNSNVFQKVTTSGKTFNRINNYSDKVTLGKKTAYDNIFTLETQNTKGDAVYTAVNPLNLRGNSQHNDNKWLLLGVVDGAYLNMPGNSIRLNITIVFLITMFAGLIFSMIAGTVAAYPIDRFLTELKRITPLNPAPPTKSEIVELNELGYTVSKLTKEVTAFSSKMSDIISLTGFRFGAFEYSREENTVLCTDKVFELLNIEKTDNSLFMPRALFEEHIEAFCHAVTPGIDQIYKVNLPRGTSKYIRLKTTLNNGKILGIIQDTTAETVKESTMKHIKDHDALTNLLNRSAFRRTLNEKFTSANVSVAALIHCDIDNMADINSRYGNAIGDKCLSAIGNILKKYHDRITCFAARTAGDEFKILVFGYNREKMEKKLLRIFNEIYDIKVQTFQGILNVHASIGIAWYPDDCDNANLLEQYAEFAMHQIKHEGKNTYKSFDRKAFEAAELNFKNNRNIETLISEGLIKYAFQPIISSASGEIYGYEALMRPTAHNSVSPHDVITFATEQNKLNIIEKLTWFTALDNFSMQNEAIEGKKIFINSIPNEMLSEDELRELEENYGEFLSSVVLEIIENEQTNSEVMRHKKQLIEKWNCLLAMDDYGSGYSNDNTLLSLKPDIIKLDIEMITGIETDNDRQTLVKNIISYAHQRNIMVLAEGIETTAQLKSLIEYGVDLLQGFYLAKPDFDAVEQIDEAKKDEIINYRNNRYGK